MPAFTRRDSREDGVEAVKSYLGGCESENEICSVVSICDPIDYTVPRILQARIVEWVAFPFSRASSQPRIEPRSPTLQVDS